MHFLSINIVNLLINGNIVKCDYSAACCSLCHNTSTKWCGTSHQWSHCLPCLHVNWWCHPLTAAPDPGHTTRNQVMPVVTSKWTLRTISSQMHHHQLHSKTMVSHDPINCIMNAWPLTKLSYFYDSLVWMRGEPMKELRKRNTMHVFWHGLTNFQWTAFWQHVCNVHIFPVNEPGPYWCLNP